MAIFNVEDLPELTDLNAINRSVPAMPSGMEKEEESEKHLQVHTPKKIRVINFSKNMVNFFFNFSGYLRCSTIKSKSR